jgi:general secretion pathway protein L
VKAILGDVYDWWTRVMGSFLGARRPLRLHGPIVTLAREHLAVAREPGDDEPIIVPVETMADGLASVRRGRRSVRGPVTLLLDNDRFVTRQASGFAVPLSRQRRMAALDLAAATPFKPGDVHAVIARPGGVSAEPAVYHIIRRQVIDPVVAALSAARLPAADILLEGPDGNPMRLRGADRARILGQSRARAAGQGVLAIVIVALVAACLGTFAHAWFRYDEAIAQARAISEPLQQQAVSVRKALDERESHMAVLAALRTEIDETRAATEIWEEVTRLLPDTAWLTDMTIARNVVRMSGFSKAAPAIIASLEGSPIFRDVEFTAPVVRAPGQQGQRFSLSMEVVSP